MSAGCLNPGEATGAGTSGVLDHSLGCVAGE